MIPVIVTTALTSERFTKRLLASIDHDVGHLVFFNQGDDAEIGKIAQKLWSGYGWPHLINRHVMNRWKYGWGCPTAFNTAIKQFPEAPYWLLVANDIAFFPGELARFDEWASAPERAGAGLLHFSPGFSAVAVTRRCVTEVGILDENIYPLYCDDCDYEWRVHCAGLPKHTFDGNTLHGDQGETSHTIRATRSYAHANSITHGRNMEYYVRKWGGEVGREQYRTPFNNPHLPLDYWKFDPEFRCRSLWENLQPTT